MGPFVVVKLVGFGHFLLCVLQVFEHFVQPEFLFENAVDPFCHRIVVRTACLGGAHLA